MKHLASRLRLGDDERFALPPFGVRIIENVERLAEQRDKFAVHSSHHRKTTEEILVAETLGDDDEVDIAVGVRGAVRRRTEKKKRLRRDAPLNEQGNERPLQLR